METKEVVIVSACRTAIGKFMGQFKAVSARELAITAGSEAIRRAGIDPKIVDSMVMGEVYAGMQGSLPARQVSMRVGLDESSNAVTVNQNCASGMRALEIACNDIQLGKSEIALVVGTENMTQTPYLLEKARMGYRMGDSKLIDSLLHDALYDDLSGGHMGVTADNVAKRYNITREECDALAAQSHQRACAAIDGGKFKEEIVPVTIKSKKGDQIVDTDEHPIRGCTAESIGKMKPAFTPDGVTTAANASGINDAAAAVVVMSADKAKELGIRPMAKMLHICSEGVDPNYMGIGPAVAIPKCLRAAGLSFDDVNYWEINEAFAAQFLGVERKLKEDCGVELDMSRINVNGSGISLGHPIGCTALRIIVSMLYEMQRKDYKVGCASLCVGGGPAMASLWTRDV
ncbi:thiolase family protein [Oscillibacter sp.]|uniref:thiolase family protein n=1 Tax=Oscillibacter sp. TaxID=1945593 RepID=UPI002637242F|nr:thiolase family protein [Oscillibacter sp.]MDD3346172.1 thiolase family protein [Oscillibacter sp.]